MIRITGALLAALTLAACGGEKAPAPSAVAEPAGSSARVALGDGMTATVATEDSGAVAAPADLPDFAPVYPGARVVATVAGAQPGEIGGVMTIATVAQPAEVLAFYKSQAQAAGMTTGIDMNTPEMAMFAAASPDQKSNLGVQIGKAEGETRASITYSRPPG